MAQDKRGQMKILEIGEAHSLQPGVADVSLRFRFDDEPADNGAIVVPAATREMVARFDRHVLNRTLAQMILRERPDAVYLRGLYGCTLDLPRVAKLLGLPVCLEAQRLPESSTLDGRTAIALSSMLAGVDVLVMDAPQNLGLPMGDMPVRVDSREEGIDRLIQRGPDFSSLLERDYALYEFCLRDHPLLVEMQRQYLPHFHGCASVLDLGCGAGIFLEMLGDADIAAMGVERSPVIAGYASGMGLAVEAADALDFLRSDQRGFDGIYCSHFIEHLPFEAVRELVARIAEALNPGGVLLLVFPDPESIRSQLLGFWRDPEHVRFYHPELIELLGISSGLACEWKSCDDQPHEVGPFPTHAGSETEAFSFPPLPFDAQCNNHQQWWWRVLGKLGVGPLSSSRQQLAALAERCRRQGQALDAMRARVDDLWKVNQTWAWQDNAALRFRKPWSK
ncbi:MAG: class I SAM-dependent methyltransferase [Thiobacillus sp.]|nr:class I SAM-dependent methyltransferase [Thiobacillus sp.]